MMCRSTIKCKATLYEKIRLDEHSWSRLTSYQPNEVKCPLSIEPQLEEAGLRDFRPGPTQTDMYSLEKRLGA